MLGGHLVYRPILEAHEEPRSSRRWVRSSSRRNGQENTVPKGRYSMSDT